MDTHKDISGLKIDSSKKIKGDRNYILIWTVVAVFFLSIATLSAWIFLKPEIPEVKTAKARVSDESSGFSVLSASGYVTARQQATVAAKVTGRITEIFFDEGTPVAKGQILAKIDDSEARAAYVAASAERDVAAARIKELRVRVEDAERTAGRIQDLFASDVASEQDRDTSEAALDMVKASIEVAEEQLVSAEARADLSSIELENFVIRAPFDGIVISKNAQPGEMVSPISAGGGYTRTGIATIVDMSSLEVEVDVNESYIAKVYPGQRVTAVLDSYPDFRIPASVRTVIPAADRQKATVKVRISFDVLDPRILPDMGVKVSFLREEQKEYFSGRVAVPKAAIKQEGEFSVVFVVQNGTVERRAVSVGDVLQNAVEITGGLREGEAVIIESTVLLKDGQKIRVTEDKWSE